MSKHNKRARKKNYAGRIPVAIMVILLVAILSIQIGRLYKKDLAYASQQAMLEQELEDAEQRSEELAQREEYIGTKEYIEEIARTKLGMVYPGEIIFREN